MSYQDKQESQLLDDFHLNVDNLTNDAKHKFPFHTDILNCLNFFGHNVLMNPNLTRAGRHIFCAKLIGRYENVTSVLNYLASLSAESKQKINEVPMIIICGMPRTGTTLLHNLMACDPACRAPRLTDMTIQPIPPILRSNSTEHKRRMNEETYLQEKIFQTAGYDNKQYTKQLCSSHPEFDYGEDTLIHEEVGVQLLPSAIVAKHTNMITWFADDKNKDFSYEYHKLILQMLHDVDPPRTHWQLKSPNHTLWLKTLLKYYPQASLIMCHWQIEEALSSACHYFIKVVSIYFDEKDSDNLKLITEQIMTVLDIWVQKIIEFRTQQPSSKDIYDIRYDELMKDPIGTVRGIYEHFSFLQWSDEFEKAMQTWLTDNPQGKQGRHSYSIDQRRFAKNDRSKIYDKYEEMFLPKLN